MSPSNNNRPQSSFSRQTPFTALPTQPISRVHTFRRRFRRGVGLILLIGVFSYFVANLYTSWLLNRELTAIRDRGETLRIIDLAPAPVPEAENAATVYMRAAAALQLTKPEEDLLSNKNDAKVMVEPALLAKNQTAIELARQAAEMHACRFQVDYEATDLAGILLPHLGKMRGLANLIRAEAVQEARSGQTEAALNDISVLFRMSEHIAPEPIMISGLVSLAIERIGYNTLAQVLESVKLTPQEAKAFAGRLPHTDWSTAIHHDLQGERCFGLWAFQFVSNPIEASQLAYGPGPIKPNIVTRGLGVVWSPLWKLDEVEYLHALDRQINAIDTPGTPMASSDESVGKLPWYAVCTRVMLPALSPIGMKRDTVTTYRRMAEVALAINAYRGINGKYPASLNEAEEAWGSPLPTDLYSGQSFIYRSEGGTSLLYSIGPNHRDDGGKRAASPIKDHELTGAAEERPLPKRNTAVADDLAWGN